ncbi:hypothetical protein SDC9_25472 [bioreactor metagenome]|uniref:Uncharacterized protein n=1 Tax=bioreactor metagenome TaxID=1076179 RepID=A0A644UKN8_9ZZZZ
MNKEQIIAKKVLFLFNPLFLAVYAFVYYLLLLVFFSGYQDSLTLVLKSFTLYVLVSCLVPILILYLLNGSSFENFKENSYESNVSYIVVSTIYFISYIYFSILNVSIWFEMGLLIPVYTSIAQMVLRKRVKVSLDIILMGAVLFYVFLLTIEFYYVLSIFPLLIAIAFAGILAYSYLIQDLMTNRDIIKNYIIGAILSVLIILFVLIL